MRNTLHTVRVRHLCGRPVDARCRLHHWHVGMSTLGCSQATLPLMENVIHAGTHTTRCGIPHLGELSNGVTLWQPEPALTYNLVDRVATVPADTDQRGGNSKLSQHPMVSVHQHTPGREVIHVSTVGTCTRRMACPHMNI
jgi:hypothetical protein